MRQNTEHYVVNFASSTSDQSWGSKTLGEGGGLNMNSRCPCGGGRMRLDTFFE